MKTAPNIVEILKGHERYWAHIHPSKKEETLAEHVSLVNEYAHKLVLAHGLDKVIDSLIKEHVTGWLDQNICQDILKECFVGTIVFHDYGKINENFQVLRMQNLKNFAERKDISLTPKHGHSKLGVFLYISYYAERIYTLEIDDDQRIILLVFACLLGYSVMQHHSPQLLHASEKDGFLSSFKGLFTELKPYAETLGIKADKELLEEVFENLEICWYENVLRAENSRHFSFPFYALIKLNFSLLTAADYLATHHYSGSSQNGCEAAVSDFGVFTNRERVIEIVRQLQDYRHNTTAFADVNNYHFEHPDQRSNKNLNKLREEMAVAVIQTVRKYTTKRLFYLEAPTGGGKTNLSAIVATELLMANPELNKIYYVFPFTTLITQTFGALKDSMGLFADEIAELHSKAGLHSKETKHEYENDGLYFNDRKEGKKDFIDNLFALYPVTLLSHVRFFDILKANGKEGNYLLHRLANSVVIIDEIQSYNPRLWDKMLFFISEYAKHFNIRFVLMSATLPKISSLKTGMNEIPDFVDLLPGARHYIINPNFSGRVRFNLELFNYGKIDVKLLADCVLQKSKDYAVLHGSVKTIVEFIYKKSAADFLKQIPTGHFFDQVFVLSGTILESRRTEIISYIKNTDNVENILLITTQVVEAGVDIDMDLGFKNISLIDSDEQLAGRVNRNARKETCEVYLFKMDDASVLYGSDFRYKKTREFIDVDLYEEILRLKNFSYLYDRVIGYIDEFNKPLFKDSIQAYTDHLFRLHYQRADSGFRIIDQESASVFVPLNLPISVSVARSGKMEPVFSSLELRFLAQANIYPSDENLISGEAVWTFYESLIERRRQDQIDNLGFDIQQKIDFKKLQAILSKYSFSLLKFAKDYQELQVFGEEKYGFLYLHLWNEEREEGCPYSYISGLNNEVFKTSHFI